MSEPRSIENQLFPTLYRFRPPTEDLKQDQEVAKLENRRVRHSPRVRPPREYGYGLLPADDWQNPFAPAAPDPDVVAQLIDWVMSQERHVAVKVMDYLDDPNPDTLEAVKEAVDIGMTLETHKPHRDLTLTDLIQRSLPCDMSGLYELARREHASKRPEAAVRQIIRNLTKRGVVTVDEQGTFHAV